MNAHKLNIRLVSFITPLSLMLAPYPILGQYYSVGLFIILFYGLFSILYLKNNIVLPKIFMQFTFCVIVIYFINIIRTEGKSLEILNFVIGSILTIFYIGVLVKNFNFQAFYKVYRFLGIAASVLIIYQGIMLFVFRVPAVPINLLPVPEAYQIFWDNFLGKRPSGFFSEPQAFCSFVIPFFIFSLHKNEYLVSLIVFVSILLSTSTLGLSVSILIILMYLFTNNKVSVLNRVLVIFIITLSSYFIYSLGILDFTIEKVESTEFENNIRLVRGFYIYSKLELPELFFGISQDLQSYVINNIKEKWVALYIEAGNERLLGYTTSYSGLLIQFGIPSLLFYFKFLWNIFRARSNELTMLVIITFILGFAQTIVFNAWFVFYISILLGMLYERGDIKFLEIRK